MDPELPSMPRRGTKRVSVQHTQERVRNNQRRHRARRKDYIASLEQKLIEAEHTILTLRTQVEALQAPSTRRCSQRHDQDEQNSSMPRPDIVDVFEAYNAVSGMRNLTAWDPHVLASTEPFISSNQPRSEVNSPISVSPTLIAQSSELETEPLQGTRLAPGQAVAEPDSLLPTTVIQNHVPAPTTTCRSNNDLETDSQVTAKTKDSEAIVLDQDTSPIMPRYLPERETCYQVRPYESTIPCSEAFILITQQNFKGMEQGDVAAWLWDGFRKPNQPGEGCRVQTGILFSLLAFISDTSFEVPAKVMP
ncbi:Trappc4 protein, Sedlin [Metarhizium guizhouense ARSEF 977]|uniref:Trappc4 protein, Sedlin n=1 Tax=Metarhizium guizhouense (strain ARSEF 977) TaxID=1276136 RepID=A0A0B4GGR9_METGA|nr:Trappc4 protein, Sedlin [Metarhizium guizhouense ARSEF 977]